MAQIIGTSNNSNQLNVTKEYLVTLKCLKFRPISLNHSLKWEHAMQVRQMCVDLLELGNSYRNIVTKRREEDGKGGKQFHKAPKRTAAKIGTKSA